VHVAFDPAHKSLVLAQVGEVAQVVRGQGFISRRRELRAYALDFLRRQGRRAILEVRPFRLDLPRELLAPSALTRILMRAL
jgi:hypothetical protein